MIINHNMGALNANRQMGVNQANANKSMEKLSSGLKINRAGDDAAGLAISEKMRGQIRGLDQATANAQDGISLLQTAEGALSETHSILQRMRELSVQASNDTNIASDRSEIQKEINQLNEEINRIAETTEFNTQKLLNGTIGANAKSNNDANVKVISATGLKVGEYDITVNEAATKATMTGSVTYAADGNISTAFGSTGKDIDINGVKINTAGVDTGDKLVAAINAKKEETGFTASWTATQGVKFTANEFGSGKALTIGGANSTLLDSGTKLTDGKDVKITITGKDGVGSVVKGNGQNVSYGGAEFEAKGTDSSTAKVTVDSAGLNIHIGANKDQTMLIDVNEMTTATLGNSSNKIKDINVMTTDGAETSITTVDDAIKQVSAERSKLGAFQNRLEHTINNLGTSSENLTSAESRIRDVNMAKEMSTFSKNNILSQAAQAMLAQANNQPQQVLQLLR